jgi:hypothetical protein
MLKKASTPKGIITIRLAQNARGASGQAYHGNLIVPHPIQILVDGVAFTFSLTKKLTRAATLVASKQQKGHRGIE